MTTQYKTVILAASYLSEQLPEECKTPEQFARLLNSSRVKSRQVAYRIPFEKFGGDVLYSVEELDKYISLQKSRTMGAVKLSTRAVEALQAIGFNEKGGSSTGYSFKPTGMTLATDESTGKRFIQLILSEPLRVYRIEIEAAVSMQKKLGELITANKQIKQRHTPDEYQTLTDNQDILIKRRGKKC